MYSMSHTVSGCERVHAVNVAGARRGSFNAFVCLILSFFARFAPHAASRVLTPLQIDSGQVSDVHRKRLPLNAT